MGILQSPCSGNCFIDRQEVQGHSKQLNGEGVQGQTNIILERRSRGKQTSQWRGGPGANKHYIGEGSRGKQITQ